MSSRLLTIGLCFIALHSHADVFNQLNTHTIENPEATIAAPEVEITEPDPTVVPGDQVYLVDPNLFALDAPYIKRYTQRFMPYGLNYLTYSVPTTYDSGDNSWEAQLSLRYNFDDSGDYYLHFTNRFDFYASTRESGPVVIRDERFGFNYVATDDAYGIGPGTGLIEFGATHWSNGQRNSVDEGGARKPNEITQEEYTAAYSNYRSENESDTDRDIVDSLSRARNYLTVSTTIRPTEQLTLSAGAKIKVLPGAREETVYGDIDRGAKFSDYDVATFGARYKFDNTKSVFYQLRIGTEMLSTASHDLAVVIENGLVPLIIKYHHGPFQRLSDYTREINVFSVGMAFSM